MLEDLKRIFPKHKFVTIQELHSYGVSHAGKAMRLDFSDVTYRPIVKTYKLLWWTWDRVIAPVSKLSEDQKAEQRKPIEMLLNKI